MIGALLISLLFASCNSFSFYLHDVEPVNHPFANVRVNGPGSYALDTARTHGYVARAVHVNSSSGELRLVQTLDCLSDVEPPHLYVSLKGGVFGAYEVKYSSVPYIFYPVAPSCVRPTFIQDHGDIQVQLKRPVLEPCYRPSETIGSLHTLLPRQLLNVCQINFVDSSDERYTIESQGLDLVSRTTVCGIPNHLIIKLKILCTRRSSLISIHFSFTPKMRKRRGVNNKPPYFPRTHYLVNVPEEQEKGYPVTVMEAIDPDGHELIYSFHAVHDARSQGMFSINPSSGQVITTASLDREYMEVHYLRIMAVDGGVPARTATTTLQISVTDSNDHSPVFEQSTYHSSVRESSPIGTTIITVRATDQDTGPNAEIEYSILNPLGDNEAFRVEPKNGVIITRNNLDRETVSHYSLIIQARDQGPVTEVKSSSATVEITVLDENDNYPQFHEKSLTVTVPEDVNWLSKPVIATVSATDSDSGVNAAIRYSLIGGNTQGHFTIDSLTAELSVISPLDYESTRSYRLVVRAQDGGAPSRSNTTQVLVSVIDVNDNDPKFYTSLFQESVLENVPIGQSIVRVQAYDPDDGNNSALTYAIQSSQSDLPLTIHKDSGWITTTREIDREEGSLYGFVVVASDQGSPIRSGSASVIIRVQDVNDNDPVFDPKVYDAEVSEVSPPGTPLLSITATDKDEDPRLLYQILSGNVRGRFRIITQNKQAVISIAQPLDYRMERRYVLTVSATDSGGRSDTATIYINVTDANTHRPVFERTPYSCSVPEDAPIGTTILVVEATDADVGENARIIYSMDDSDSFRIDPSTGAVVTTQTMDRESIPGYTLVVSARDNGLPPLSDTTNVEVEVSDVNDNPPVFHQEIYTEVVSEDALIGTSVLQIHASDADLNLNGQIRYSFLGNEPSFSIDPTSGIIRTARILDRETMAQYNLVAWAIDRGVPPLSASVTVTLYVEDVNDNPPHFEADTIKLYVPENSPIGWTVGKIQATDPDEGPNASIQYSIVGGQDAAAFSLSSRADDNSAELMTRTELDYESAHKVLYVIVRASSPPLRADAQIEVWVTDVNDNPPRLQDFSIIFNNYKNHFPLDPIGRVPAYDADVSDELRYKFIAGNNAELLLLNKTSGEIRLSPSLNTNVPIHATMEVSVFDGLNEVTAQCQLTVRLVTAAMLFHSITVRLADVTETEFLSPAAMDAFRGAVAAILPCPRDNVLVFSVQADSDVLAPVLNVSFSVLKRHGAVVGGPRAQQEEEESYLSPRYLQEKVYLNRAILAQLANVQILPFDDNLCVREPCINYENCQSVLKFGNASGFIASSTMLFRPIYPVHTFACKCPPGFTGMHHRYECDTEVNLCYSNPCRHNGTCLQVEGGYTCLCREGYTGPQCEVKLGPCDSCRSNASCPSRCESCSEWTTPHCQLRSRSFTPGTFLTFPSLNCRYRFTIKLKFATRSRNGLILYNGRHNEKHDFIALEIVNCRPVFSFSLGLNTTQVPLQADVCDGLWHSLEIQYLNRTATIILDDCDATLAIKFGFMLKDYKCANSGTQVLEPRCLDSIQTCYRFLDLTGPLQLGGVPVLPTDFQVANHHFSGCLSDVYINHKLLDLSSFVADNGTKPGCPEKKVHCPSQPCQNGGTCKEGWNSFICLCPEGYGGPTCNENLDSVKQFLGDSYVLLSAYVRPIQLPWTVSLGLRTRDQSGLLLRLEFESSNVVELKVIDGYLLVSYNDLIMTTQEITVADGTWHHLEVTWHKAEVELNIDHGQAKLMEYAEVSLGGHFLSKVTAGGYEPEDAAMFEDTRPFFKGCLRAIRLGGLLDPWIRPSVEHNIRDGCHAVDHCSSNPCPFHSDCFDSWNSYHCKCHPGYVGEHCIQVCELAPCGEGATCLATPGGYSCLCGPNYTGSHCEVPVAQDCPVNWWGQPICGPCDCDTARGYDGNCNKSNGDCYCQVDHFQPPGSDVCFSCDCFALGSYSNRCNHITGQCRCRAGVIGRRCDSCSNAFAEVTLRGCEVVYDGCPRSFSQGIWWDRTLFDQEIALPCPKGYKGKATRFCSSEKGWEPPDLFKCTSELFSELADNLVLLEEKKLQLNTYLSIKLSRELQLATSHDKPLYGMEVLLVARLLHHLLNQETLQRGLNLTHRQDRYFIKNLVSAASSILNPGYEEHWARIASISGNGPEDLMYMFGKYSSTLLSNQEDTYTAPFEIISPNMVFGVDTVSAGEMWEVTGNQTIASPYLEAISSPPSGSGEEPLPAVVVPKYNNYPSSSLQDPITKALLPLPDLGIQLLLDHPSRTTPLLSNQKAQFAYCIYPTLGKLLPGLHEPAIRQRFGLRLEVNSPVFTLIVRPTNSSLNQISTLLLKMRLLDQDSHTSPQCVFWNMESGSRGKWSNKGCKVSGIHPEYVNCTCNHLTSFAILMDVTNKKVMVEESRLQAAVSYLGVGGSLIFLGAAWCVLSLLLIRHSRCSTNSNSIHRNLAACLFLAQALFLAALKTHPALVLHEFSCKMVAISLHYLFLCVFFWMFVEALHLYRMLTEMRDINHGQMRFYYTLGYGIPAIIVGLAVGVRADQYGNYYFCWLSMYQSVIWSLVGPVCLVVLLTLAVFAFAIRASVHIKDTVADFGNLRTLLWVGILLLPLLGATWVFVVLSANESPLILHYCFSSFSLLSGIYIFVGYCIINKKVNQQIHYSWARLMGKKVPYDESLCGTRTTVASRSALAYHNSSFDVLHRAGGPPHLGGIISTSSTTSRSTAKTSGGSPYRSESRLRPTSTSTTSGGLHSLAGSSCHRPGIVRDGREEFRAHKKHSGKKIGDSDSETEDDDHAGCGSLGPNSLDLASSHSSDEDEYEGNTWRKRKINKKQPVLHCQPNIMEDESNIKATLHEKNVTFACSPTLPSPQNFNILSPSWSTSGKDLEVKSGLASPVKEVCETSSREMSPVSVPTVIDQKMVIPPLVTAELSTEEESEDSNETSV